MIAQNYNDEVQSKIRHSMIMIKKNSFIHIQLTCVSLCVYVCVCEILILLYSFDWNVTINFLILKNGRMNWPDQTVKRRKK